MAEQGPRGLGGRGPLLARIGHDVRSPLGVVSEVLALIESDLEAHLTDEHRLLLSLAGRSLARLRALSDRLRIAAELDAGTLELARDLVDTSQAARRAVDAAVAMEARRDVEVLVEDAGDPCLVTGDSERLAQALTELVVNGLRHARRRVRVGFERTATDVRIAVEDDGDGVPPTLADDLATGRTRDGARGLGLGLTIASELARAQGGRIEVESGRPLAGAPRGARLVLRAPRESGESEP